MTATFAGRRAFGDGGGSAAVAAAAPPAAARWNLVFFCDGEEKTADCSEQRREIQHRVELLC